MNTTRQSPFPRPHSAAFSAAGVSRVSRRGAKMGNFASAGPFSGAGKPLGGAGKRSRGAAGPFFGAEKRLDGTKKSSRGAEKPLNGAGKWFSSAGKWFSSAEEWFSGAEEWFSGAGFAHFHPVLPNFTQNNMKTLTWGMLDPATGLPYTWDNPNLRWGDPSVVLEPGDPGYTPPVSPQPNPNPKTKNKTMQRNNYYPSRAAEQAVWHENFAGKLAKYTVSAKLDALEVAERVKDAKWLHYVLGKYIPAIRAHGQACTQSATRAQTGPATLENLALPVFTAPELLDAEPRPPGALNLIFEMVARLKLNPLCTPEMCSDLGIVGSEQAGPDPDTLRPLLKIKPTAAGVFIGWGWQGFARFLDSLEIQVDRGDGKGWQILTFDTTPDYTDTHPIPGTLSQWKYRAIFRVDDSPLGLWSEVMTVTVGG